MNCDSTFELKEMIVEPNPLHQKPRRLAKQISLQRTSMTIDVGNKKTIVQAVIYNFIAVKCFRFI